MLRCGLILKSNIYSKVHGLMLRDGPYSGEGSYSGVGSYSGLDHTGVDSQNVSSPSQ